MDSLDMPSAADASLGGPGVDPGGARGASRGHVQRAARVLHTMLESERAQLEAVLATGEARALTTPCAASLEDAVCLAWAGDRAAFAPRDDVDGPVRAVVGWDVLWRVPVPAGPGLTAADRGPLLRRTVAAVQARVARLPAPAVALGGAAFDVLGGAARPARAHTTDWHGFGPGWFAVPRVAFRVVRAGGQARRELVVHLDAHTNQSHGGPRDAPHTDASARAAAELDAALDTLTRLAAAAPEAQAAPDRARVPGRPSPRVLGTSDAPDQAGWTAAIADALGAFDAGHLQKVVAARARTTALSAPIAPGGFFTRLRAHEPRAFHFLFTAAGPDGAPNQVHPRAAFVGATPECLLMARPGRVHTEAIAGTHRRTGDDAADAAAGTALLASAKDRHEHALVADMLKDALGPLSDSVHVPAAPVLLDMARVAHLHTPVQARLSPGVTAADVAARLHPTPAVGGTPRAAAMAHLAQSEAFDRGWYAGAVGLIGAQHAVLCVAIRSALLLPGAPRHDMANTADPDDAGAGDAWTGPRVVQFSGAGIVPGSDAAAEWREIDAKLAALDTALGLDARVGAPVSASGAEETHA